MNETIAEALGALEGQITPAPEKIPAGMAVIGIELDRDPACSAQYVTSITPNWLRAGRAVAIKDGHVIRGSHIFGRFSKGLPEVTACHWLICPKCGNRVLMPTEVWKWKDYARDELKVPQAVLDEMQGSEILAKWGSCSCSGKWEIDRAFEKEDLTIFIDRVLKAIEAHPGTIPGFVPPTVFDLFPLGTVESDLPPEWQWLIPPLSTMNRTPRMYRKDVSAELMLYNPGFWIGCVADPDATGFFWSERKKRMKTVTHFNPFGVEGL